MAKFSVGQRVKLLPYNHPKFRVGTVEKLLTNHDGLPYYWVTRADGSRVLMPEDDLADVDDNSVGYPEEAGYNETLDGNDQVDTEEAIASIIFSKQKAGEDLSEDASHLPTLPLDEEDCASLGRNLLYLVLRKFRPDLFDDYQPAKDD